MSFSCKSRIYVSIQYGPIGDFVYNRESAPSFSLHLPFLNIFLWFVNRWCKINVVICRRFGWWPIIGAPNVPPCPSPKKNKIFYCFSMQVCISCLRAAVLVLKSVHGNSIPSQYFDGTINPALFGDADQIRCVNNSKFIFHGFILRAASPIHAGSFGAVRQCFLHKSSNFLEY